MFRVAAFLVVSIVLAGCQGSSSPRADIIDTGTLILQILDPERVGLPGVRVQVDSGPAETTDAEGFATFLGLEPGDHVWSAHLDGFMPVERRFSVGGNETASVQAMLLPASAPFEINYYFAEFDCASDAEESCAGSSKTLDGVAPGPMRAGFRNATLRAEWSGGGEFGFRLESRRNGSALPFADHAFNQSFAGASPLIVELPQDLVSPPMRLSGTRFSLGITQVPGNASPTHILVTFAAYSETGANDSFPSLRLLDEHTITTASEAERAWNFDAGASDIVIVDAVFERDCPFGSHAGTHLTYTDATGNGTGRRAQPAPDGDYRCGVAVGVPPEFQRTSDLGPQYLWGNATWTLALSGECTCRVQLRVLEGMLPR